MRSLIFGIFAHPDDEAFGPCGYLIQKANESNDVHLICVTDGSNGQDTAETRDKEIRKSANVIGAKSVSMLGFLDGSLCNNNYSKLVDAILQNIKSVLDKYDKPLEISFVTFEPKGITGHLDHIAVSLAVTYIYTHSSEWLPAGADLKELRYFCLCDAQKAEDLKYFIYSPKGYPEEEIDETAHISDVLSLKKQAISAHASQEDHKKILEMSDHLLANEHFILYKN